MKRMPICALAVSLVMASGVPAAGPADETTFIQLTSCGEAVFPSLDASAQQVAFTAVCDLVPGQNPDGIEVFLLDISSGRTTQLTNSPSGTDSAGPRLSPSGKKVVFGSNADLVQGGNPDGSAETFIMNVDGSGLTQLTHTSGDPGLPATFAPAIDYPGREVFFTSTLDLVGGNADQSREIFAIKSDGIGLRQLTASFGDQNTDPSVDASGHVYFICNGGCLLNAEGPSHLMRIRKDGTGLVRLISIGNNGDGTGVDAAGSRVAFSSTSDLVPGSNADLNMEIFVLDVDSGELTQVTSTTGDVGCSGPVLSANGMTLAFSCDRDLVPGSNTDLNREVFLAKLKR